MYEKNIERYDLYSQLLEKQICLPDRRSIYCPKDVCTAVFIESQGLASVHHPDSLGCFNYEGSLFDNMYPDYINRQGLFLTPDAYR